MKRIILLATIFALAPLRAAVPETINYQGRVVVGTTNFTGTGQFKFALVNGDGSTTYWSNDGTSAAGSEPAAAVSLPVSSGLYSLRLGDVALANMTAVPASVFAANDVRLRVWFNDGVNGFEMFTPDQRFGSAPYAFRADVAESVADGVVTASKLADGAVTGTKLAPGTVTVDRLVFNGTPNIGQVLGYDGANLTWVSAGGGGGGGGGSFSLPYTSGPVANNGALFSINNIGATDAWAIYGHSQTNLGIFGQTHADAQAGVLGRNDGVTGAGGAGVFGYSSTGGFGVLGISEGADGVWAATNAANHNAVYGQTSQVTSVAGRFNHYGFRQSAADPFPTALTAEVGGSGWGLFARSVSGFGVFGQTTGGGVGVYGRNEGATGSAIQGYSSATAAGARGDSEGGDGVVGNTNAANRSGVVGFANQASSVGAAGYNSVGIGVKGDSSAGDGVWGNTNGANKSGVVGFANHSSSNGVAGINAAGTGVFGQTSNLAATAAFFWNTSGGDAIRTDGNVNVNGTTTTKVLTITGGADVAEPFQIGGGEIPKGSVVVIDEENPGALLESSRAYDTRVAGIVSGANGVNPGIALHQQGLIEGGQHVALSGRVYVRADATQGAIKPGDLLTTSPNRGHAMRVDDHSRAQGAVLGKAMTPLAEGTGYVLVLVTLQ